MIADANWTRMDRSTITVSKAIFLPPGRRYRVEPGIPRSIIARQEQRPRRRHSPDACLADILLSCYPQPAQDEDEQPPQPDLPEVPDEDPVEDFPMPNFDSRFSVSCEPQLGHTTSGFDPNTSFSKQLQHFAHWYS